jgi:hypothetical protein
MLELDSKVVFILATPGRELPFQVVALKHVAEMIGV